MLMDVTKSKTINQLNQVKLETDISLPVAPQNVLMRKSSNVFGYASNLMSCSRRYLNDNLSSCGVFIFQKNTKAD